MNKEERKSYFLKGLTAFLVIAASIVFYFVFLRMGKISGFFGKVISVLQPLIFGLVIAYLVNPIVNFFNGKLLIPFFKKRIKSPDKARKVANAISVALAMIIFCIILVGLVWLVIPQFVESVAKLVKDLPGQIDNFLEKAQKFFKTNGKLRAVMQKALEYGKKWFETKGTEYANIVAASLASGIWSTVNVIKDLVIGIIFAIYIMFSKRLFVNQTRKLCYAVFKESVVNRIFRWCSHSHQIFSGFINGKLIDSLIIGALCFIGSSILRMPYTVLVSVIIGVTNIVPVFGPWIGGIPCCLLIMLVNPLKGLYFGIFVILLQTLDGNIIGPKILGSKTGISTFWVMFAIVFGAGMFGFIGMVIGVPAFAVVYLLITTLVNRSLKKKNKSTDSSVYQFSNGDLTPNNEQSEEQDA